MAWLSGLAGKAETLLNKIDQNTAAVLNKEKNGVDTLLTEVKWVSPEISPKNPAFVNSGEKNVIQIPEVVSSTNIESTNLNSMPQFDVPMQNTFVEIVAVPKVPSVVSMENVNHLDSDSEMSLQSGRSSPSSTHRSFEIPNNNNNRSTDVSSEECNFDTTNDVHSLPGGSTDSRFLALQREFKYRLASDEYYSAIRRNLEDKNDLLSRQQTDHQKEINTLKEKLHTLVVEKRHCLREIADLKSALERGRLEIESTKSDLDQHKARASKILQEKEKLITELRSNCSSGFDESAAMEISQLRQEKECLREENQQICEQLKLCRQDLLSADAKVEQIRTQAEEAKYHAQELINMEKRRRLDAEEDAKNQSEELKTLKDEMSALRKNFSSKSLRQENEISRLRSQMSAMATPSSEVESRLSTLTQTLVSKQQALELLTTERNALRLQLEKLEQEYRLLSTTRRNDSYNSVNDTDDAKAQVPTFLVESPFDTGVARRVKRAYSTLDAISIRTGVFLRRYPLVRILVFIYMGLLHLWVLIVLLSQSPDAH